MKGGTLYAVTGKLLNCNLACKPTFAEFRGRGTGSTPSKYALDNYAACHVLKVR